MTRFWLPIDRGVEFVLNCLAQMAGGEIFVPRIPSMRLGDLANVIAPQSEWNIMGLRPGEKLHEVLLSKNESAKAREFPTAYVIREAFDNCTPGKALPAGFEYSSDRNEMLSREEMEALV
jgi:UDP-N-acetylglucosamine 4,6-dehydratase